MEIIRTILKGLSPLSLTILLIFCFIALNSLYKSFRNERSKKVKVIDVLDIKTLFVENIYFLFIKISFYEKLIKSQKVIEWLKNKREIKIIAIPYENEVENIQLKIAIKDELNKLIGRNIKIKYKFKKNVSEYFWRKISKLISSIFNNSDNKSIFKDFFKIFKLKFYYIFTVLDKKEDISVKIIKKFSIFTNEENFLNLIKYRKVIKTIKNNKKENLFEEKLKPITEKEILSTKLEELEEV